jgi:hypothetical protein
MKCNRVYLCSDTVFRPKERRGFAGLNSGVNMDDFQYFYDLFYVF